MIHSDSFVCYYMRSFYVLFSSRRGDRNYLLLSLLLLVSNGCSSLTREALEILFIIRLFVQSLQVEFECIFSGWWLKFRYKGTLGRSDPTLDWQLRADDAAESRVVGLVSPTVKLCVYSVWSSVRKPARKEASYVYHHSYYHPLAELELELQIKLNLTLEG